ncbi:MAG: patatin-like phospholipase family protein [Vulcanimicrobiaceae bacterium]
MQSSLSRASFMSLAAAGTLVAAAPAPTTLMPALATPLPRVDRALVLSGGGARGAYQAGLIDAMVADRSIADGRPLAPYGLVCGTSIGALNGYFVATGQYRLLRHLWYSIARQRVIRLKREYASIPQVQDGVGTRIWQAMRLAMGLDSRVKGVLDGRHLRHWLAQYINPTHPVLMPFVWPVTNLTTQQPEFFALLPEAPDAATAAQAIQALAATVGSSAKLRLATPAILVDALQASAAIPVAFDPVTLPGVNGSPQEYVDGGVIANTPVGVARAGARAIDVVFLDPIVEAYSYGSAVEIATGAFGAMQKRILEADLRSAYFETFGKRAILGIAEQHPNSTASREHFDSADLTRFVRSLYDVNIRTLRPQKELPVDVIGFDDERMVMETYRLGFDDARRGFAPYTMEF